MTELEVLNFSTSAINNQLIALDFDLNKVNWPNVVKDQSQNDEYVEVSFMTYMAQSISLKMSSRIFGCVTISVFSKRDEGCADAIILSTDIASCLSAKIFNGLVFNPYDLRVLDHTLSQRQTTTPIPRFQVNCNLEFSCMR